jgi:hypothetical protein
MREMGKDDDGLINLKEYTKVLVMESSCLDTRDRVSK